MLVSWEHKFLFVHIPKTGGTSIVDRLSPYARRQDRLVYRDDFRAWPHHALNRLLRRGDFETSVSGLQAHAQIDHAIRLFGADRVTPLFRFAFVRNPYTRAFSYYAHIRRVTDHPWHETVKGMSFEEVIPLMLKEAWFKQAPYFCKGHSHKVQANYLGAFEQLEADFAAVCARLDLTDQAGLKKLNVNAAPIADLEAQFGGQLAAFREAALPEFELFGYSTDIDRAHEPPTKIGDMNPVPLGD